MRDIWRYVQQWQGQGRPFALARVVQTWGSSPRQVGAAMIVLSIAAEMVAVRPRERE